MGWTHDKRWSDQYLPEVKRIVGPHLLEEAPLERDRTEATDLQILNARDMRIGVRIRRAWVRERWPHQVTFRYSRETTGAPTEWEKIKAGWCDWVFYGHARSDTCGTLAGYVLLDMQAVLRQCMRRPHGIRYGFGTNRVEDGRVVRFLWMDVSTLDRAARLARMRCEGVR